MLNLHDDCFVPARLPKLCPRMDSAWSDRSRRKRASRPPTAGAGVGPSTVSPDPGSHHRRLRPSLPSDRAFTLIALRCLESMVIHQDATARGELAALHQMRIAITCLRTAVSFFSPMVAGEQWTRLKQELKWLNGHLGAARDLDVVVGQLHADGDGKRLTRKLTDTWSASHARVAKALRSDRFRRLIENGAEWIQRGQWRDNNETAPNLARAILISEYASRRLKRWQSQVLRKGGDLAAMDADARHRLRIRTKRVRYAVEWFGNLLPGVTPERHRAMLKELRRAQRCLGELNDAERAKALVDKNGAEQRTSTLTKQEKRLIRTAQTAFLALAELSRPA
ncbi:MAG: CHAD domain-containing protein [Xanthobacteraceae bacterium]|jgi:CHAD domain-containing protein